ncbi:MAG: bacteriohemerythrin [Nitrospirota bacterium]
MEWTNLSTGVKTIDEHNRRLVSMINKLVTAIKEQSCKYIIGDVISFLEEYSVNHCAAEEVYMLYCGYPEYRLHKKQHNKFIDDVIELKKESLNPDPGRQCASYELSVETNRLMTDWVFDHIADEDKKLGVFLNECQGCINIHNAEHLAHKPS